MDKGGVKILFIINDYHQYEAYIRTQALEDIKDRTYFIANPALSELDFDVPRERVFFYSYPDSKNTLHRHIFNLNTWRLRKKSIIFWIQSQLFKPRQVSAYKIMSVPGIYQIVKFAFLKRAEDRDLFELVRKINPSIILIPSHAYEGHAFELIRIARKINVPSFMVIDNWDTLGNKTIFTFKPDYLGVWSRQQVEHAVNVKNMPKDRVIILGTPKFKKYMKPSDKPQPSPYPFRYALYAGMSDLFDELGALKKIDKIIDENKIDIRVVYRPTPIQHTRRCPDVFFEYDFKHVVLDAPARHYYKKLTSWDTFTGGFDARYYPDSGYFRPLLSNMEFMISAQTTMILEAALLGKRNYILAYSDGIHRFNPKFIFDNFPSLFGIVERLENVRMVRRKEDLEKIFAPGDQLKRDVQPLDIDYFVSKEATANYASNLEKAVEKIIAQK